MRLAANLLLFCLLSPAAAMAFDVSVDPQAAKAEAPVVSAEPRTWSDTAGDAGLGALRVAGWMAGYAQSGKDAVAPYAAATIETARSYGSGALDWGYGAAASGWGYSSGLVPSMPSLVQVGSFDATVLGVSSRDLALSAVSSGAAVGVAGYGCATLALPAGPAASAGAYFGCSLVGARVADWGLRAAYAEAGIEPDERAFAVGAIVGSAAGGWGAARGVGSEAVRVMLRQYGANPASTLGKGVPVIMRQVGGAFAKAGTASMALVAPAAAGDGQASGAVPATTEAKGGGAGEP